MEDLLLIGFIIVVVIGFFTGSGKVSEEDFLNFIVREKITIGRSYLLVDNAAGDRSPYELIEIDYDDRQFIFKDGGNKKTLDYYDFKKYLEDYKNK